MVKEAGGAREPPSRHPPPAAGGLLAAYLGDPRTQDEPGRRQLGYAGSGSAVLARVTATAPTRGAIGCRGRPA